jgi:dual specificity tyrosine-phosphorylation-regulated kinase 2/3/4
LTDYEKGEILDYKQVWFVGDKCKTKIKGCSSNEFNQGYDDEKGDYLIQMDDHIGY